MTERYNATEAFQKFAAPFADADGNELPDGGAGFDAAVNYLKSQFGQKPTNSESPKYELFWQLETGLWQDRTRLMAAYEEMQRMGMLDGQSETLPMFLERHIAQLMENVRVQCAELHKDPSEYAGSFGRLERLLEAVRPLAEVAA